jgi:hypothetical protein
MTGHGAKFGRKKEQAIVALLSQRNIEEAARVAGIGTKTLMRWMQIPEFKEAYRKARRDTFSQAIARLQQHCGAAASTLLTIMADPKTPAASRVRAADRVFEHAAHGFELEDLQVRLQRLEENLAERNDWPQAA